MTTFIRHAAMILFCCGVLQAQAVEKTAVQFPAYSANKEIAKYAGPEEYADAVADKNFRCERWLYKSEGAVVSGYLYSPAKNKSKLPVIIFLRGNYVVHDQAPVLLTMFHRLAKEGFIVFAPMLRGSDGTEGHDEMGGRDLLDVKSALDLVGSIPNADPENVYLYGESRGAMMTYFAIREGWKMRAAAIFGGLTNIREYLAQIDPNEKFAATVWPDYATHKEEILDSRSAIKWPEKINTPLLIMHGGADKGASPLHSLKMAEALTTLNREYSLMIFAGDNHILSKNRNERDRMAVQWFREHRAEPAK